MLRSDTSADFWERNKLALLFVLSVCYLIVTCALASQKEMWTDEFFTFYASRLPALGDVWSAARTGEDITPPLFFVWTRAAVRLFGSNAVALRLPSVLGFWIMCLCLFRIVEQRAGALYGFVALLFPLVTGAYSFAYEARGYAIAMGCASAALLSWLNLERRRRLALVCMGASLTLAVSSHYYAVLIFLPLAIGEAARIFRINRIDLSVWATFILSALLPLVAFWPMIRAARSFSAGFWSPPRLSLLASSYSFLLAPAVVALIPALVLLALYVVRGGDVREPRAAPVAWHELAAAVGFILIPPAAFIVALTVTNAFTERYTLPAVVGFACLLALALSRLPRGRVPVALVLLASICLWFPVAQRHALAGMRARAETRSAIVEALRTDAALPIVSFSIHSFMPLTHYAPEDVAGRLVYLADTDEALPYFGTDTEDRLMLGVGKGRFGLNVQTWAEFLGAHQRFLAVGPANVSDWLTHQARGRRVELLRHDTGLMVFMVSAQE